MSWCAVLIAVLSITPDSTRAQAYDLFTRGSALEDSGKYEPALELYLEALKQDPASPEILRTIAKVHARLKRFDQALKYAVPAYRLDPKDTESIKLIGTIYLQKYQILKAMEYLEMAYKTSPEDEELIVSLSYLYEGMNQLDNAKRLLGELIAVNPSSENYLRLGNVSSKLNKYQDALGFYQQARQMDSSSVPALLGIGTSYDVLSKPDSALPYYVMALARDTMNVTLKKRLIDIYTRMDRFDELTELCSEVLRANPLESEVRRNLGYGLYKKGDRIKALEQFLIAAGMNPADSYGLFHAARIYVELGQFKTAEQTIKRAIKISPDNTDLVTYLGFIHLDLKQYDEAGQAFRQAVILGGDRGQLHYLLGVTSTLQRQPGRAYYFYKKAIPFDAKNPKLWSALAYLCDDANRKREALECFEKVIALDTMNASALNYVGYTYAEQGIRLERALNLVKRAIAMEDTNGYYIDSLGWIYFMMGEYEAALEQLKKAAGYVEDAVVLEHLGDAYLKVNDREKAKEAYEKGLKKDPKSKSLKKKLAQM